MSPKNSTASSLTTMAPEYVKVTDKLIWIPYFAIGCVFAVGLALSFRRHHLRQVRKKRYVLDYEEENLSFRRPRISGLLTSNVYRSILRADLSPTSSNVIPNLQLATKDQRSQSEENYKTLRTEDVLFSVDNDLTTGMHRAGVKKRFRSAHDVYAHPLYRQISDDEYFRRKGPRDSLYLKSASERHLSPNIHKQHTDLMARSLWVQSETPQDSGSCHLGVRQNAVKYIKVFNLDLCTDCRINVERADYSSTNTSQNDNSSSSGIFLPRQCSQSQPEVNKVSRLPSLPDIPQEVSIVDVHPPPAYVSEHSNFDFQPISTYFNDNLLCQEIVMNQLRPRSAPDLTDGNAFSSDSFSTKPASSLTTSPCHIAHATMNSHL